MARGSVTMLPAYFPFTQKRTQLNESPSGGRGSRVAGGKPAASPGTRRTISHATRQPFLARRWEVPSRERGPPDGGRVQRWPGGQKAEKHSSRVSTPPFGCDGFRRHLLQACFRSLPSRLPAHLPRPWVGVLLVSRTDSYPARSTPH